MFSFEIKRQDLKYSTEFVVIVVHYHEITFLSNLKIVLVYIFVERVYILIYQPVIVVECLKYSTGEL